MRSPILASVLALTIALLAACASGTAIVTGTTRAAIAPEQVKLYGEPPAVYEVIGLVSASSEAGLTPQGSMDYAVAELKSQAAKLGANGVLVESTSQKSTLNRTVQGKAIFVKAQ